MKTFTPQPPPHLTFDVRGGLRLAARRPLDGGVSRLAGVKDGLEVDELRIAFVQILDGTTANESGAGEKPLCLAIGSIGTCEELGGGTPGFELNQKAETYPLALMLTGDAHQRDEALAEKGVLKNSEAKRLTACCGNKTGLLLNHAA